MPQGRAGFLERIWERIKAHKVVQCTLAYLAVAYTLLHGAEMLSHSFSWPHTVVRAFAAGSLAVRWPCGMRTR